MTSNEEDLVAGICNRTLDLNARVGLIGILSALNPERALQSVIRVAGDADEDHGTLVEMGKQLAAIADLHRYPTEFESRDILEVAYNSFCDPSDY